MPRSIGLPELLDAHHAAQMDNVHTCLPCKVLAYNPSTQTADCQVLVKRPGRDEDGEPNYEALPAYAGIQVAFPRAGAYILYLPISAGDFGHLIFCDMATGEARSTGQVSEPQDVDRHSGGYAIFLPGGYPDPEVLSDTSGAYFGIDGDPAQVRVSPGEIKIGKTATDYVVLATALQTALVAAVTAATGTAGNVGQASLISQLSNPAFLSAIKATIAKAQ